jgi:D-alanyl-D-alanine carboxypeptidase
MGCVSVEASRRLRWGCLSLAAIVTLLTVTTDPADARSRRKRHHVKSSQAPESYNPPYAAIVVDARSGAVLHQSAADNPRHPASLTKIMTLYLLFERLDSGRITLDTPMDVSEHAASQAPTKLGLKPGSTIRVEDAIKGLVTKSANDAAVVVAETLGASEEDFARAMTHKAHALGMRNTVYRNASGLPDDEQVTTARDQALLGIAIQERFPKHYRYFSLASFVYRGHAMANHNRLLGRVEGVDGIKTGYTRSSGFNLVTSVKRGARRIVAVVLGGRSGRARDARMRDLIDTHIAAASTRDVAVAEKVEPPTPEIAPRLELATKIESAAKAVLAAAGSTPALPPPLPAGDATATVTTPGSGAPITPVKVKTVTVKLVPPKHAMTSAAPKSVPPPAKPEVAPKESARQPETAPPAIEGGSLLGALPAMVVAAKEAAIPAAKAEEPLVSTIAPARHSIRHGWIIQVGAYESEAEAKEKLGSAQTKAAALLQKTEAYTERTTKGDKIYFRARFAGFDRDRAEAACKRLKREDIACMALKI